MRRRRRAAGRAAWYVVPLAQTAISLARCLRVRAAAADQLTGAQNVPLALSVGFELAGRSGWDAWMRSWKRGERRAFALQKYRCRSLACVDGSVTHVPTVTPAVFALFLIYQPAQTKHVFTENQFNADRRSMAPSQAHSRSNTLRRDGTSCSDTANDSCRPMTRCTNARPKRSFHLMTGHLIQSFPSCGIRTETSHTYISS